MRTFVTNLQLECYHDIQVVMMIVVLLLSSKHGHYEFAQYV